MDREKYARDKQRRAERGNVLARKENVAKFSGKCVCLSIDNNRSIQSALTFPLVVICPRPLRVGGRNLGEWALLSIDLCVWCCQVCKGDSVFLATYELPPSGHSLIPDNT